MFNRNRKALLMGLIVGVMTPSGAWPQETDEPITIEHSAYIYFQFMVRVPASQAIARIENDLGVEAAEAAVYLAHMKSATDDLASFQRELSRETCARANELESVRAVADAMNDLEEKSNARRDELVRGFDQVLSPEARMAFDVHVTRRARGVRSTKIDYEKYMIETGADPRKIIGKSCDS